LGERVEGGGLVGRDRCAWGGLRKDGREIGVFGRREREGGEEEGEGLVEREGALLDFPSLPRAPTPKLLSEQSQPHAPPPLASQYPLRET
jgi:hypothetical protein